MLAGRKERTAHGTQTAGRYGAEAVDIKAMIDFSTLSLCNVLLLIRLHGFVVDVLKVQ